MPTAAPQLDHLQTVPTAVVSRDFISQDPGDTVLILIDSLGLFLRDLHTPYKTTRQRPAVCSLTSFKFIFPRIIELASTLEKSSGTNLPGTDGGLSLPGPLEHERGGHT